MLPLQDKALLMSPSGPEPVSAHVAVLPAEVLHCLDPQPGQTIVDATVGAGGHARLLAERIGPGGLLIGLDQDAAMLRYAERGLRGSPAVLVHRNFEDLPEVLL